MCLSAQGLSRFSRIFLPFSWLSNVQANGRNAALLAEYTPKPGKPFTDAIDPVMMIDPPSLTLRIDSCGIGVDEPRPGACGPLGGQRQCLRVDILPDLRQLAISNGMSKTQWSLNGLFVALIFPGSDADDQNAVSLRHEFGGFWVCRFYLFGRLLKHIRQSRVPAMRTGERPVLAGNDPLNIFRNQRKHMLLIAAAYCCKEIFHNLDILFDLIEISPFALHWIVSDRRDRFHTAAIIWTSLTT